MLVAGQIRAQKNFRHSLLAQVSLWRSHRCVTGRAVRPRHPNNGASLVPQFIHTVSLQENISVWRYGQLKSTTRRLKRVWADFFPANVIVILETLSAGGPNDKMGGIRQSIWGRGGDNTLIRTGFCALGRKSWKSIFRLVAEQSNLSGEQVSYRLAKPLVLASHIEWWQLLEGDALSYRGLDGALKGADLKSYSSLKKSDAEWFVKGL